MASADLLLAAAALVSFQPPAGPCPAEPVYLSEKGSPAYVYLQRRQHDIYTANPSLTDPLSRAELTQPGAIRSWQALTSRLEQAGCDDEGKNCLGDPTINAELLQQITCGTLPTRFESPLTFSLLRLLLAEVDEARFQLYPASAPIQFGTLPIGKIDAEALQVPDSTEQMMLLNRDVFYFTGAFSKSVSNAMPISREGGHVALSWDRAAIRARLRQNPQIVSDFAEAMVRLVLRGSPRGANEVFLDDDHNRLHARLVGALDKFIVAHEAGHVALKHTGRAKTLFMAGGRVTVAPTARRASAAGNSLTVVERSQEQELAADALGFRFIVENYRKRGEDGTLDLAVAAAGGEIFFRIVELTDLYAEKFGLFGITGAAHPPAKHRSAALDKAFRKLIAGDPSLRNLPDFRPMFRESLAVLSDEARPIIEAELRKAVADNEETD
jgi:hypothetical protein